jgi:pimeloyl-ACP methyl ester carboxylesterase
MSRPDTVVLIHGFWVTPRSWEHWVARYEAKGFTVHAPAYPGFEVEVEALNADPSPIEAVTVPQIMERLEGLVGGLDAPPILIGHSAGGVFTQLLLDRGYGAAGVAINSAPTEGVKRVPLSQIRATFPVLKNPANRHRAVGFTEDQWRYAFANTFSEEESRALYERYHIPASGSIFWGSALANIHPGHDDNHVDYRNDDRAPLLFIVGSEDHLMPPSLQRSNAKHYKSATITAVNDAKPPPGGGGFVTPRVSGRVNCRASPPRSRPRRPAAPPGPGRRSPRLPRRGRRARRRARPRTGRPRTRRRS